MMPDAPDFEQSGSGGSHATHPVVRRTGRSGWLAGLLAGAAALGTAEALARLIPRPSLVLGVGEVLIANVPPSLADTFIGMFGRNDKSVLVAGVAVVSLLVATVLGVVAARHYWMAAVGFVAWTSAGVLAGISRSPTAPLATVMVGASGAGVGLACLRRLLFGSPKRAQEMEDSRRDVLRVGVAAVAAAMVAVAAGRRLAQRVRLGTDPADVRLAVPASPLPQASAAASVGVAGVSTLFTPNRTFYRIDTALIVPRVEIDAWRLAVTGLVERPLSLSYRQLSEMNQVEADVTISCVSNDVGGDLVGTARWQGVPLTELLGQAGVRPDATQIVGRSLDGWTAGFPTAIGLDGRAALVALGMNGSPLPLAHGFPARLVVPGLYGYVSATKWLREIECTTLEAVDGYWVPRGWAKEGPIKTTSRIDVPRQGATLRAGRVAVGGVAWAPHRGVARVEVSVDGEAWTDAAMAEALSVDSWRQWRFDWDARPGPHELRVRMTDGAGQLQVAGRSPLKPAGATGYHAVRVNVAS